MLQHFFFLERWILSKTWDEVIDCWTSNSLINAATNIKFGTKYRSIPLKGSFRSEEYDLRLAQDDWAYGQDAINRYLDQPTHGRIFKSLKRFFPILALGTRIFGEAFSIQDLIARQLRFMRNQANEFFQADVEKVVMGYRALLR